MLSYIKYLNNLKSGVINILKFLIPVLFFYFIVLLDYGQVSLIFLFTLLIYTIFTLSFFFYIFNNNKIKSLNNNSIEYDSIITDKEYLLFKSNLNNFYGTTIILLFIFIFKNNSLNLGLNLNIQSILILFIILITYSILLSNYFNLKLFHLYTEFIFLFDSLIKIKFDSLNSFSKSLNKNKIPYGIRYFSTDNKGSDFNFEVDPYFKDDTDQDYIENKKKALKEFKNKYKGGYLGYNHIYHFGNIVEFGHLLDQKFQDYYYNLEEKITEYLDEIPERITYCILPVLRWETVSGELNSITITSSIKITRDISKSFLARRISNAIFDKLNEYHLRDLDIDLFLMGRP